MIFVLVFALHGAGYPPCGFRCRVALRSVGGRATVSLKNVSEVTLRASFPLRATAFYTPGEKNLTADLNVMLAEWIVMRHRTDHST